MQPSKRLRESSTLDKERCIMRALMWITPGLALSGFLTWPGEFQELMLTQSLYLVHAGAGLLATPAIVAYLVLHLIRTLGNRSFPVFFSGLSAGVVTATLLLSGLWLIALGQTETTRWVLPLHIGASITLLLSLLLHLIFHVQNRNIRKKGFSCWPSLDSTSMSHILAPLVAQVGLTLAIAAFWGTSVADSYRSVPSDYTYVYGPHPLQPSETKILGGQLVQEEVLGGSEECGSCHQGIFKQWLSSAHRKAAMDPAYEKLVARVVERSGMEAARYCDGCHGPRALLAGMLTPKGSHSGMDGTAANNEGVSCVGCHAIRRALHTKGVASYEFSPPHPYLFEYSDSSIGNFINHRLIRMRPELHRRNFSAARIESPEFCATCHVQFMDEEINQWGWVKMQDEYTGWLNSPYSGRSQTGFTEPVVTSCNGCHMTALASLDPSASTHGLVRDHAFAAANTFIPTVTRDPDHLEAVRRFLSTNKMRLTIDLVDNPAIAQAPSYVDESLRTETILPDYYYLGQKVKANILVTNTGVGHDFPGGTIDINEAWVAFQITDAAGRKIQESGALDAAGHVDSKALFYRSVPVDREGKHLWKHDLFKMTGEHYRNIIPAGKTDVVPLEFEVPYWAVSPLTISVQLNYRKLTQRYTTWITGDPKLRLPVVVMAQDAITLPVRTKAPTLK